MLWVVSKNFLLILTVTVKPGARLTADADRFFDSLEFGGVKRADRQLVKSVRSAGKEFADVVPDGKEAIVKDDATDEDRSKADPRPSARRPITLSNVTIIGVPRDARSYPADRLMHLPRPFIERERDGFRDLGPDGSILVGIRVSFVERFGGPKVRSVQPIYRSGKAHYQGQVFGEPTGPIATFVASPGYAVGGLVTHSGMIMDGFGIVFMKVDGDKLDPKDAYHSPWIGDKQGGSPSEVTSPGGVVVGLEGRADRELKALGLAVLK